MWKTASKFPSFFALEYLFQSLSNNGCQLSFPGFISCKTIWPLYICHCYSKLTSNRVENTHRNRIIFLVLCLFFFQHFSCFESLFPSIVVEGKGRFLKIRYCNSIFMLYIYRKRRPGQSYWCRIVTFDSVFVIYC